MIRETRKICKANDFLKIYICGLQAYWEVSVETSNQEGKVSHDGIRPLREPWKYKKNAGNMFEDGQVELSIAMALSAAEKLEERYSSSASHSFC